MSNAKKDFSIMCKLVLDFVNSLTEEQFNNLINGTADIKYNEKGLSQDKKERYNCILYNICMEDTREKAVDYIKKCDELSTKLKLNEFCKYFRIEIKVKDSIDTIINKIIEFVEKDKENIKYKYDKQINCEKNVDTIAQKLEECIDIEEAKEIIYSSDLMSSKIEMMKLAKRLKVFNDKDASCENIAENIIKTVVEAKIRSYIIRKKI